MTTSRILRHGRGLLALVVLVAVLAGAQASTGPSEARARHHTVKRGQTLSHIAKRYGVPAVVIAQVNGITSPDHVRAGHRLIIPPKAPGAGRGSPPPRGPAELLLSPDRLALTAHFDSAAREFGVPPDLLKAVAWQESGWQNHKVSPLGAQGIGQLMPATAIFINEVLLGVWLDPRRPDHNVRMSARYLAYLLALGRGDQWFAVAAYYQGPNSLRRMGPKPHTHGYVAAVTALRRRF